MEPTKTNQKVQPIPEGMQSVTPFIMVKDAEGFIEYVKEAFGARLTYIFKSEDDGTVMHATVKIGNSTIMIADSMEREPVPAQLYMYVENIDEMYNRALRAGAESVREPVNEFYGDRSGGVKDNWGNTWWIATHIEDVSEDEMKKREQEWRRERKSSGV